MAFLGDNGGEMDAEKLKQLLVQRGYAHLTEFARAHGFNRATLHH